MTSVVSALANGFVLSALLALAVWLALRLLKRSFNAATRYVIWWIALLAVATLPAAFLRIPNQRSAQPALAGYRATEVVAVPSAAPSSNSTFVMTETRPTKPSWLSSWLPNIPIQIASGLWAVRFGELWALISVLLLLRLAAGFAALHFQKKHGREASLELCELVVHCLARRGIKRRVLVLLVPEGNSPMLAGVSRPCILIPERLRSELDRAELEQILLHEVTHAGRYDDWTLLLQRVIQAVFVFHPLVHWVARRINLEREAACDAEVVAATGDARAYAKCLAHVAELSLGYSTSPLAAAIANEKSYLARRILMLLDRNRQTATRILTVRLALAATAVCLLAVLAATSPSFFAMAGPKQDSIQTHTAMGSPSARFADSVAGLSALPAPRVQQSAPPVTILVTVTEPTGRLVSGLPQDSFVVFENGARQEISSFSDGSADPKVRDRYVIRFTPTNPSPENGVGNLEVRLSPPKGLPPLAVSVAFDGSSVPGQSAQTPPQSSRVNAPDWEKAAGGHMEFEIASVKENKSGVSAASRPTSNVPLDPQNLYAPTGGLFSATNFPLLEYMMFAYKLTPEQTRALQSQVPWANTNRWDIEGRASGNPTKDQIRLMMQTLLADRFKLALHFERRQLPVFALVLDKPGKLGPQLRSHVDDPPCSDRTFAPDVRIGATIAGGFPELCGGFLPLRPSAPGRFRAGARDVPMTILAMLFGSPLTGIDRPVLDGTGLAGKFDIIIEFTPQRNGAPPTDAASQSGDTGPTFLEALKDQLGLKLDSTTGPVETLVIDHIEQPTPN